MASLATVGDVYLAEGIYPSPKIFSLFHSTSSQAYENKNTLKNGQFDGIIIHIGHLLKIKAIDAF